MRIFYLALLFCVFLPAFVLAQPANDNACGAINLPLENLDCEPTATYSWTGATYSAASGGTTCTGSNVKDVWYKVTVPANGELKVAVANANFLVAIEFYKGADCNSLSILGPTTNIENFPCLYSDAGYNNLSRIYTKLVPGSDVYLRVYSFNSAQADASVKICVSNTAIFSDEPCNAGFFPLEPADPLGQACSAAKNFNWTNASLSGGITNPDCMGSMTPSQIRDVWFKVKVPASGKLIINTHANNPQIVQVLSAPTCSGPFTQLACLFVSGTVPFSSSNLTPNSTLYVRLFQWGGGNVGNVNVCVAEKNDLPAVNNSTGKVGIGIDSPFAKLHVIGTGYFNDKIIAAGDVETRGNLIVRGNIIGTSAAGITLFGSSTFNSNSTFNGSGLFNSNSTFTGTAQFNSSSTFAGTTQFNSQSTFNNGLTVTGATLLNGPNTFKGNSIFDNISIGAQLGSRLALYGPLAGNHYGFGIQGSLLQMYADAAGSNIAFGSGSSSSFTERARIINSGEYGMQLKGRLQLTTGTQSAGLWLTNTANTINTSFIGLAGDNQVGFFGATGANWGLTMNTTTGNVGIGLNGAAAQVPLQFSNTLGLTKISLFRGAFGDIGIGAYGGELRLQNDIPSGKVSLGVLENTGAFTELAKAQRNGAFAFSIFGNLWANGTTYPSDGRFKKNIEPLEHSLEKVLQLQGVSYEMKTDEFPEAHFDADTQVGLIAQDVEKIIPEVISEGPNGYKAIDYAKLVPLLIESIKAQQKQMETQQQQIFQLKKQMAELLKRIKK